MKQREIIEMQLLSMLGPELRTYFPAQPHEHQAVWINQTFQQVTSAVASGDKHAIALACNFIALDPKMPFGKLVKSALARALKKQVNKLIAAERVQLIDTTVKLLNQDFAPRELEDYCKLIKKFSNTEVAKVLSIANPRNAKSTQLTAYLRDDTLGHSPIAKL